MNIEQFFSSRQNFTDNEYELKSKIMAMNLLLLVTFITLTVMSVIRFNTGNTSQGIIDISFSALSGLGLFWLKKDKKRLSAITRITLFSGLVIISALLINVPEDTLRIGWFLVLLVPGFFLGGWRSGIILSILSLLTVTITQASTNTGYSNYDIGYYATLLILVTIFLSFYENRIEKNRLRLQLLNSNLEDKVIARTAELARANKELKLFFHALDTSFDSVVVTDIQGLISYTNKATLEFTGFTSHEMHRQSFDIFCGDKNFTTKNIILFLKQERHWENEFLAKRKNGSLFPAFTSITTIFDESNNPLGILFIIKDLTEIKQAEKKRGQLERKLHQSSTMEAMGQMAGGVAHDLNNILSGIVGYPELLLNSLPENSTLRGPIQDIHSSGKRAAAVVDDLLTLARGAASIRKNHNLNHLVEDYIDSPEGKKLKSLHPHVTYTVLLDEALHSIHCSHVHITKSIMNLITNATEAISDTGTVTISTKNRYVNKAYSLTHQIDSGDYVVLSVKDTGAGISSKDLQHIFEPFYTKKIMGRSGSGLGLAIVWNTVQDHDGKVFVERNTEGTCFQLYFHASKHSELSEKPPSTQKRYHGNGEKILIVDDEELLQTMGTKILHSLGYRTIALSSGREAVAYLKDHTVDLVLLDMLMEPDMDGQETYKQILQISPKQKAIIVSAFSQNKAVKETLALGAGSFIKKPYDIDQLSMVIFKELNRSD